VPHEFIDPSNRDAFSRGTWEEALERAASVSRHPGSRRLESVAGFVRQGPNEEAYLFRSWCAPASHQQRRSLHALCHASSVAALMKASARPPCRRPSTSCKNSEVIVVIGANPTENHRWRRLLQAGRQAGRSSS